MQIHNGNVQEYQFPTSLDMFFKDLPAPAPPPEDDDPPPPAAQQQQQQHQVGQDRRRHLFWPTVGELFHLLWVSSSVSLAVSLALNCAVISFPLLLVTPSDPPGPGHRACEALRARAKQHK